MFFFSGIIIIIFAKKVGDCIAAIAFTSAVAAKDPVIEIN